MEVKNGLGALEGTGASFPRGWRHWAALGAILLLGIVLRTYNLPSQSVWYDEYLSAGYLDRPDLISCLRDQRVENWEMVPLYYTIEYYWAWCVGGSMTGVRCLSVLFGVLAIGLVYKMGERLHSPHVGLFAALCMALSPFHIFHAQGIRPYAMVTLLALISAYAFWDAVNGRGRKWWAINILMNLLLFWTHLFSVLVLLPQGCFLLLFRRRPFRQVLAWGSIHLLLLVPVVLWVTTIRVVPNESTPRYAGFLIGYFVCMPFALRALRLAWGRDMEPLGFLCLWWVLPGLALIVPSMFWTNCLQDRYVVYSWPAAYLLVGVTFLGIQRPRLRAAAIGVFVLTIGLHAGQSLSVPLRTDYLAAAQLIKEESTSNDTIIVHTWFQRPIFAFNMHTSSSSLNYSANLTDLCSQTDAELRQGKAVWVVMVEGPEAAEIAEGYERYLADNAIPFTKTAFPGMQWLYVFHCVPAEPDGVFVSGG